MTSTESKTKCTVTYPIVSALVKAEEFLKGKLNKITPTNDYQKKFIEDFYHPSKKDVSKLKEGEIESIADTSAKKINKWLRQRGFSIELNPIEKGGFGVASVLDLLARWTMKGSKATVVTEDKEYFPGVKMGNSGLKFYRTPKSDDLVIEIETKTSDRVFLMMAQDVPSDLMLVDHVERIHAEMKGAEPEHEGIIFPKIDMNLESPIDWILNLRFETPRKKEPFYYIAQALQQTKLKMNEEGFRVKSAVAMGMILAAPPRKATPYIINRPFLMWIRRPGFAAPLMVAYLDKDVWKDPEGLDM